MRVVSEKEGRWGRLMWSSGDECVKSESGE